jgi:signal transduction histidine kinase
MTGVSGAGEGHGWAGGARRGSASPPPPPLFPFLLWLLAVGELLARVSLDHAVPGRGFAYTRSVVHQAGAGAGAHLAPAINAPDRLTVLMIGLICLATTVPLAFLPRAAAAVTVTAAAVLSLTGLQFLTAAGLLAVLIAAYRLGATGSRLLAPGLTVPFPVLALAAPVPADRVIVVLAAALAPAAALTGVARQARSEAAAHGAAREVIAGSLLEHTARGERARIARELHDVVAHHISMIAVQAETARLATPGMPEAGAHRLLDIGDTARAALTEMRRLLGVLREDARAATPGRPGPDRQPQPGLRELNELLDASRDASGTCARLILSGPPAVLDPGTELAAYRIIQEALTNARRHAPGAAVDVELRYADDALQLRIRDNGPGPPPAAAGGHGLTGMRERAAAVGGELRAGAAGGGGFLVEATLPVKTGEAG